jgi:CIC family chloride channel protein
MPPLRAVRARLRALVAPAARRLNRLSFLRRWLILGTLIGAIAGVGAVVFYSALSAATRWLLTDLGGYRPPTPAGEGFAGVPPGWYTRPWAIPLVAAGGALLAGVLVARFAPEAEGHGTDAAISAVHHNPRGIRVRAIVVKILASAITIGSGGSGGREGPTGQISAGFGSLLARVLDLSPADARIAVSSGIGSGIGAIFGAPLGGAVLSAEILYRDDVEPAAIVPSFVASIVAYAIFAGVEGFTPLFGYNTYYFRDPVQIGWFALLGVAGGLIGLLYAKGFYGMAGLFDRLPVSRALRPALGGLAVGLLALAVPEVLGTGYGWIQQSLGASLLRIPLWIVVLLPFLRILATGFSIGSGGSGGIFGPGMVIGAFTGAAFWRVFDGRLPGLGHDPVSFVIVGMMCCFGSIARAPLAVMIMVAEMTGSLEILGPAMAAVGVATLIVSRTDDTIYRSQPKNRAESGAGRVVVSMPLLSRVTVAAAMTRPPLLLAADQHVGQVRRRLAEARLSGAAVLDEHGRLAGVVEADRLASLDQEQAVESVADATAPTLHADFTLDAALEALATTTAGWAPVVDAERRVIGVLRLSDVTHAYRKALAGAQEELEEGAWAIGTLAPPSPGGGPHGAGGTGERRDGGGGRLRNGRGNHTAGPSGHSSAARPTATAGIAGEGTGGAVRPSSSVGRGAAADADHVDARRAE